MKHLFDKKEMIAYRDEMINWIKTDEFKSLLSPYPPLLNPKKIDYTKISAQRAWDLNLPLPQFYKFIYLGSHGMGNNGLLQFLNKYGGHCIYHTNENNPKKNYIALYEQIIEYLQSSVKPQFVYLALRNYIWGKESKKFYSLINAKRTINLVRDPISCLSSLLSTKMHYNKSIRNLTLDMKPKALVSHLVGYVSKMNRGGGLELGHHPALTKESIEAFIDNRYKCFHDTQLIDEVIHKGEMIYIDMQEIIGEKSFHTFQNLAHFCNFPGLDEKEKAFFENKVSEFQGFLPLTLHICEEGIDMDIFITTPYWLVLNGYKMPYETYSMYYGAKPDLNTKDISQEIFTQSYSNIILATDENLFQKLKDKIKLFERVREYINDLVYHIQKQKSLEDKRKINESDIINFFKHDKNLYFKFDNILNQHLLHLKNNAPNLLDSWEYYKHFKKLRKFFV